MQWGTENGEVVCRYSGLELRGKPGDLKKGILVNSNQVQRLTAFGLSGEYDEDRELRFTRGSDLFSSFFQAGQTVELYWRLAEFDDRIILLESITSIRVDSQKAAPIDVELSVGFVSPMEVSGSASDRGFLVGRSPDHTFAFGVIPHRDDETDLELTLVESGIRVQVRVPFLERGVIRRVRCLMPVSHGPISTESMQRIENEFNDSEIPLTT